MDAIEKNFKNYFNKDYIGYVIRNREKKGQDMIKTGIYEINTGISKKPFIWMVCADGHGSNTVIDILKGIDYDNLFKKYDDLINMEIQEINNIIDQDEKDTKGSGSTITIVKIFEDKIICSYLGDSSVRIFRNGYEYYKTKDHKYSNVNEKKRIDRIPKEIHSSSMTGKIKSSYSPQVLTLSSITMIPSYYIYCPNGDRVNMTRCLGHGIKPRQMCESEINVIRYNNHTDKIKLIIGSDGFWDMISETQDDKNFLLEKNAESLCEMAFQRWKQEWIYEFEINGEVVKSETKFEEKDLDDISVGIWSNYSEKNPDKSSMFVDDEKI